MSTTKISAEKIANVIIPVTEQDAMIDFYVDKLGATKRVDVPFGNGYRWVEVGLGESETTIALAPPPENAETGNRQTGITLYAADIEGYHAQLQADGVDVDEEISRMGGPVPPMFWLRDAENNTLLVVGDMS